MSKSGLKFEIEDIKLLYKKAEGHNLYYDEINEETRKIEAFLIQSALLEGVLCEIALRTMGHKFPCVLEKRESHYGLNSAIDDLYLLKVISDDEFKSLGKFKNARNKYFHTLLEQNPKDLENQLGDEYSNFEEIAWNMVKKLEKLYKK